MSPRVGRSIRAWVFWSKSLCLPCSRCWIYEPWDFRTLRIQSLLVQVAKPICILKAMSVNTRVGGTWHVPGHMGQRLGPTYIVGDEPKSLRHLGLLVQVTEPINVGVEL